MSFVTTSMKESLKDHVLEEALPPEKGFLAYYMKRPGDGRIMSTLIVFTPEGIAILGDLTPERHGSISAFGYGVGWFGSDKSEYYLCEKFLSKEWQVEVAQRWCKEHLEELQVEGKVEGKPVEDLDEWEELLSQLQGRCGEMDCGKFQRALYDMGYEVEDEGFEYPLREAGWLCAIQQRFAELYSKLPVAVSDA